MHEDIWPAKPGAVHRWIAPPAQLPNMGRAVTLTGREHFMEELPQISGRIGLVPESHIAHETNHETYFF